MPPCASGRLAGPPRCPRAQFGRQDGLPLRDLPSAEPVAPAFRDAQVRWRERLFSPALTLWAVPSQALGPGGSCRARCRPRRPKGTAWSRGSSASRGRCRRRWPARGRWPAPAPRRWPRPARPDGPPAPATALATGRVGSSRANASGGRSTTRT